MKPTFRILKLAETTRHVKEIIVKEKLSVPQACDHLGISYASFMQRINGETKEELKRLGKEHRASAQRKIVPLKPQTREEEVKPKFFLLSMDEFPKIIYRVTRNELVREYKTVKCRFFMRVEAEKYYMLGYEFEAGAWEYQPDIHLYVYHKELPEAVKELRAILQKALDHGVKDDWFGIIKYALQKKEAPEAMPVKEVPIVRTVQATTPIYLRDGEYECSIQGDMGRIDYQEATFHFTLPDKFEKRTGLKINIKNKEGILTL